MRAGLVTTVQLLILVLLAVDAMGAAALVTARLPAGVASLGALALLGVAAALVCVLALLRMVEGGRVFDDPAAPRWVDAIVVLTLVTTIVLIATEGLATAAIDPALAAILITATGALGLGFALLVAVMRGLLRQAAALTAELAEVV